MGKGDKKTRKVKLRKVVMVKQDLKNLRNL